MLKKVALAFAMSASLSACIVPDLEPSPAPGTEQASEVNKAMKATCGVAVSDVGKIAIWLAKQVIPPAAGDAVDWAASRLCSAAVSAAPPAPVGSAPGVVIVGNSGSSAESDGFELDGVEFDFE